MIEKLPQVTLRKITDYIKFFVCLLIIYFVFWAWQHYDLIPIPVEHYQMAPIFRSGDLHKGIRQDHWYDLKYGDVVYLDFPWQKDIKRRELLFFARVIGLPGDSISFQNGRCYRNGTLLEESYVSESSIGTEDYSEIFVPRDYVYLLVDNRNNFSKEIFYRDSRFLGPIPVHIVQGCILPK